MDFLKSFFKQNETPELESIQAIEKKLTSFGEAEAHRIALFAFILGRVAYADLHISPEEIQSMQEILAIKLQLSPEKSSLVCDLASQQNIITGATDHFLVTRKYREIASRKEKEDLLECLFEIGASDGSISNREDNEIKAVASELGISHESLVLIRAKFSQYRDALK